MVYKSRDMPNTVGVAFWIATLFFCFSGLSNSYLANELDIRGAGNPLTGFQPAATWVSQFSIPVLWFLCRGTPLTREPFILCFKYWYILLLDVVGQITYWAGMGLVGSGLTTVLYSSIVVSTGLFSWLFYGKNLSRIRWVSILVIWASIGLSAAGQVESINDGGQVLGIIMVLISALSLGLEFVFVENVIVTKVSPLESAMFFWPNAVLGLVWICIFDGMFWRRYVTDPIKEYDPGYSASVIGMLLALLVISNGIHQLAFYFQINGGKVAAVTVSVNKSMQAVLVFVLSDIVWCPTHSWNQHRGGDTQSDQCINTWKLLGFIGTVIGALVYSLDGLIWGKDKKETLLLQYEEFSSGE